MFCTKKVGLNLFVTKLHTPTVSQISLTNFERFNEHYFELKERLDKTLADQSLYKEITEDRGSSTITEKQSLQVSGLVFSLHKIFILVKPLNI